MPQKALSFHLLVRGLRERCNTTDAKDDRHTEHSPLVHHLSILSHLDNARAKIMFDKFHIAQHLYEAVDTVRQAEYRAFKRGC